MDGWNLLILAWLQPSGGGGKIGAFRARGESMTEPVSGGQPLDHFAGQLARWPAVLGGGETCWSRRSQDRFFLRAADRAGSCS